MRKRSGGGARIFPSGRGLIPQNAFYKAAAKFYNCKMTAAERAAQTRILFLDVDGVLTDGRLYALPQGMGRAFHTLDGQGIRRVIRAGIPVALVSAADGEDILLRARQLGILRVHLNVDDKLAVVRQIAEDESVSLENAAYMGDDLPDLPPLQNVGFAVAPSTAADEVLAAAHWIPQKAAGAGAVRELCDFILREKS